MRDPRRGPTPPQGSDKVSAPTGAGAASGKKPQDSAAESAPQDPSRPGRARLLQNAWVRGLSITVAGGLLVAYLSVRYIEDGAGESARRVNGETVTSAPTARFTVENAVSRGVWVVEAPTLPRMYPREERPESAVRWLPDGATIALTCSQKGASYRVIVNMAEVRWQWWAQLEDRGWIPVAPLKEALRDGSQGLPNCRS